MIREHPEKKQPASGIVGEGNCHPLSLHEENIHAALALLLGPETDYTIRIRATRRLARKGPELLPVVLKTLNTYPDITAPPWPCWPPQYEHCSRLLLYLCQHAQLCLEDLLHHPAVLPPIGPVLWTSIIEAASLLPRGDYEPLLCQGLEVPWTTVRYAAAMALALKAEKVPLQQTTIERLYAHQGPDEAVQVRLTVAYALLSCGESCGLNVLIQFMHPLAAPEARKAAMFILATELSVQLSATQREQLTWHLLQTLQDSNAELALHAAHALSRIAAPSALASIGKLLDHADFHTQLAVLTTLEELACQANMRHALRQQALPAKIMLFLRADSPEIRRQASYTLAACGGEYVAAVLGTIVLNKDHPGHIEAIDSLRLLYGVLRTPARANVIHWLLQVLEHEQEEIQVTALDSLAYLLWQARTHGQRRVWHDISQEIIRDGTVMHLLGNSSAWVRQRATELLGMLGDQTIDLPDLQMRLLHMLYGDSDSGVRACVAYVCGQIGARWAIPGLLHTLLDADEHVAKTALTALSHVATADDSIVLYSVKELKYLSHADIPDPLAQAGLALLKKWRQDGRKERKKKLHSSGKEPILSKREDNQEIV